MAAAAIGRSLRRQEDHRLLTGGGRFLEDIDLPGQARAVVLRSSHAHADLDPLDIRAAAEAPGVLTVLTGAGYRDAGYGPLPSRVKVVNKDGSPRADPPRWPLAIDRVRHVGDPIAMVIAETETQARDAVERITVGYAERPAVTDPLAALAREAPQLWDEAPGNLCYDTELGDRAAVEAAFARAPRITEIDHSPRHAATNGFICSKVRRFDRHIYGEERLHCPGSRRGAKGEGQFNQITWDQALETVAGRMRAIRKEFGAEAILPLSYGGSNGLLSQDTTDARLFRAFGTSRLARTVCAAPTTAVTEALYGRMPGVAYEDYRHARLIVIWGANPSTSGFHLVPHVRAAARDGATVVVIDPRRTPLAKRADIHLAVRPGTDVVIALAIHRFLFEHGFADESFLADRTHHADELRRRAAEWTVERAAAVAEVDPDLLERTAALYAETSPAVIRCGWGLERNRNGGNAAMAVLALPAVGGKFGVRGGGFSMSSSRAMPVSEEDWIETGEPGTRLVNMNHLGRALTEYDDPPVKMLFVYNCNPLATMPAQNRVLAGLERDDLFTVVFDQVMTDTARWADVVLPATTFLEQYDLALSYGHGNVQLVQPVIEAVGESRPNVEVFGELASRLGIDIGELLQTDTGTLMHVAGALPDGAGEELLRLGITRGKAVPAPVQFGDVFPRTPDGRINLLPAASSARPRSASIVSGRNRPPTGTRSRWSPPPATRPSRRRWASCARGRRGSRSIRATRRRGICRPATSLASSTTTARSTAPSRSTRT